MENIYKTIRIKAKMKQDEFANYLGTTIGTINRWENNKTEPTKMALLQLARFCEDKDLSIFNEVVDSYDKADVLFHGSKSGIVGDIKPNSRSACDFGKGFYMGEKIVQPLTLISGFDNPIFYYVKINYDGLKVLDLKLDLDWALLIAFSRGFMEEYKGSKLYEKYANRLNGYDLVRGYIADDKIFTSLTRFFNKSITDVALINCLLAMDLGKQTVAITEKACNQIKIIDKRKINEFEKIVIEDEYERLKYQSKIITDNTLLKYRREGKYFDEIMEEDKL